MYEDEKYSIIKMQYNYSIAHSSVKIHNAFYQIKFVSMRITNILMMVKTMMMITMTIMVIECTRFSHFFQIEMHEKKRGVIFNNIHFLAENLYIYFFSKIKR